jgi:hypothetical protein
MRPIDSGVLDVIRMTAEENVQHKESKCSTKDMR